ncbi:LysR family transcriptional regulator [Mycolicibacterium stellerae]|uniref:LysR family transcriptional regulator n=1 Tax=Mycolicibacterium stellerae TaxID=2358193 RepID=UPI000F0B5C6D|nr:LysR family transcriptional regulator [Mycolicibacterium stellerae]
MVWSEHDREGHRSTDSDSANRAAQAIDVRYVRSDDLRILLAIARTGRRRSAAAALGIDHTTVSRRLASLEKSLGVRLVQNGADGWELTEIGAVVAEHARAIEDAVQSVTAAALGIGENNLRGTIRVTAPDGFGSLFVAPALARMRVDHPDLVVELATATRSLNLHQSGFDVAIAVGTPVSSRLVAEQIGQYALGLYASRGYLRDFGEPTTMQELQRHPLIFFIDSLLRVGDLDLHRHLPGVTAKFMSTNIFAHLAATQAGGGIGLLPAFMGDPDPDLRRLLPADVDVRLSFTLAARRESLTNPAVQAVRTAIQTEVARRRAELLPPVT